MKGCGSRKNLWSGPFCVWRNRTVWPDERQLRCSCWFKMRCFGKRWQFAALQLSQDAATRREERTVRTAVKTLTSAQRLTFSPGLPVSRQINALSVWHVGKKVWTHSFRLILSFIQQSVTWYVARLYNTVLLRILWLSFPSNCRASLSLKHLGNLQKSSTF